MRPGYSGSFVCEQLPQGMIGSGSVVWVPPEHVLNKVDGILTRIRNESM